MQKPPHAWTGYSELCCSSRDCNQEALELKQGSRKKDKGYAMLKLLLQDGACNSCSDAALLWPAAVLLRSTPLGHQLSAWVVSLLEHALI
jgi:hypothetical protein